VKKAAFSYTTYQQEKDPQVFLAVLKENQRCFRAYESEIRSLHKHIAELEIQLRECKLGKKRDHEKDFEPSSEKWKKNHDTSVSETSSDTGKKKQKKPRGKSPLSRKNPATLPVDEHKLCLEKAPICACNKTMHEWVGQEEVSRIVTLIPARIVVHTTVRTKYVCPGCDHPPVTTEHVAATSSSNCEDSSTLSPHARPLCFAENSRFSIAFCLHIVGLKYIEHMPLQRMVAHFARQGLPIDSQTLYLQCKHVALALEPAYLRLARELRKQSLLFCDETTWSVHELVGKGKKPTSRWYFWSMAHPSIGAYYEPHPTRAARAFQHLLALPPSQQKGKRDTSTFMTCLHPNHKQKAPEKSAFRGIIMADGYSVYESTSKEYGLTLLQCWAHVRRKFFEAKKTDETSCAHILDLISKIYRIEVAAMREKGYEPYISKLPFTLPDNANEQQLLVRGYLRQNFSKPLFEQLKIYVSQVVCTPNSAMGKAIHYFTTRTQPLSKCFDDPTLPLDNNLIERAIRNPVIGRKIHYGSHSKEGVQVATILYSLIETCKMLHINPELFLQLALMAHLDKKEIPLPHELIRQRILEPTLPIR
jgi:transposase